MHVRRFDVRDAATISLTRSFTSGFKFSELEMSKHTAH